MSMQNLKSKFEFGYASSNFRPAVLSLYQQVISKLRFNIAPLIYQIRQRRKLISKDENRKLCLSIEGKEGLRRNLGVPLMWRMARIAGVDLPAQKRIEAALPYIYGIGLSLARKIINECQIDPETRTKNLTEDEVNKLQRQVEKYKVEGDLKREIQSNIKRLQEIGAYRGIRHSKGLPVRGQRTKTNARTKRGKKVTIGTVRKEVAARTGTKTVTTTKT